MSCTSCSTPSGCNCAQEALSISAICNPVICSTEECSESFSAGCILYTLPAIVCGNDTIVPVNQNLNTALQDIVDYFCGAMQGNTTITQDISCGLDLIATEGDLITDAIDAVVTYFCNEIGQVPQAAVAAGNNISVTEVTVGNVTTYTVKGKEAIVAAGDNVTVTPVTVGDDTTYTIDAKEAIVGAGANVVVTANTVGLDTTYTVNSKEAIVEGAGDIVVTPLTVGYDTTYTVELTSPLLKKFTKSIAFTDELSPYEISITKAELTSCHIPTEGCFPVGTSFHLSDFVVTGFCNYYDESGNEYWLRMDHLDKTTLVIDSVGDMLLTGPDPRVVPTISKPYKMRLTIIG